jgi:cytochrome c2
MSEARGRRCAAGVAVALAAFTAAAAAQAPGDPGRGRVVFEAKHCARCHVPREQGPGMGPALQMVRRPQGMLQLAGRLWNHAPAMLAALGQQGLTWPSLDAEQMADLAAFLQADPARDPPPDLLQGQATLIRKGCLKCHRLAGEGGSVGIELTRYPEGYRSPVAWAAAVWGHAPRMAQEAQRAGVLYPRFIGDEMANLVAFLRSRATAGPR